MAASIARIRLLAVRTESWLFPLRIGFSLTCRTCQREFQSQKLSPLLEHDNGAASSLMRPNTQQWLQASAALSGNIGSAGGRGLRRILGLEFPVQMTWTSQDLSREVTRKARRIGRVASRCERPLPPSGICRQQALIKRYRLLAGSAERIA